MSGPVSGASATASAPASTAASAIAPTKAVAVGSIDSLTTAIYSLQRQMGSFATRLSAMEGRGTPSAASSLFAPQSLPFDMPVYGAPPLSSTPSTIVPLLENKS